MDRIEIDEDSEAAEDSELTLEIFIILAVDEELVVVNIGAGGKGNIVFEEAGGGDDIDKDPDDAEEFSDNVTLFTLGMLMYFFSLSTGYFSAFAFVVPLV